MNRSPTKILIADDHPIVREGLKQIIADAANMFIGGEATCANDVLDKVRNDHWDVLILDISMPDRDGLDVLEELQRTKPTLPVLVLSMYSERQFAIRALKAGASGYLTKDSVPTELVRAIQKVLDGGTYVTPALAEMLAQDIKGGSRKLLHETLTDREYHIMLRLAEGQSVSEIADTLLLSIKTVSTHRAHILSKLHVKSNVELAHYAMRRGWLR